MKREINVWDYSGKIDRLHAIDDKGNELPFQLIDRDPVGYWDHFYIRVLVEIDVPAFGYSTCAVCEKEAEDYPALLMHSEREELPHGAVVLENEHLCARFDTGSGMLQSLTDKASGEELLSAPAGLHLVRTEDGGMSAWRIGRYLEVLPVTGTYSVRIERGEIRQSVTYKQKLRIVFFLKYCFENFKQI